MIDPLTLVVKINLKTLNYKNLHLLEIFITKSWKNIVLSIFKYNFLHSLAFPGVEGLELGQAGQQVVQVVQVPHREHLRRVEHHPAPHQAGSLLRKVSAGASSQSL